MSEDSFAVTDVASEGRFELRRDGELVGYASYQTRERSVIVPHVETLFAHRGQGFAARLMDGLLDMLRADGRTIVPLCSFAAEHIRTNPAHHDLVHRPEPGTR